MAEHSKLVSAYRNVLAALYQVRETTSKQAFTNKSKQVNIIVGTIFLQNHIAFK